MTVRTYNFTKRNGALCKAKRRFTKVNGVRKRILAGWTKQNGVVEQVYRDTSKGFYTVVTFPGQDPNSSYPDGYPLRRLYVVDEEKIFADCNAALRYWPDYDNGGSVENLTSQIGYQMSSFFPLVSFNYANGVVNNQSILSGVRNAGYVEMPLADPMNPVGSRLNTRTYPVRAPIKTLSSSGLVHSGIYDDGTNKKLWICKTFADSSQVLDMTLFDYSGYYCSTGLTLSDGEGYNAVAIMTTTINTNDTTNIYLIRGGYGTYIAQKLVIVPHINTGSRQGSWRISDLYTIDGSDVYFSFQATSHNIYQYTYFCKYIVGSGHTKTQLSFGRKIIGTYAGSIYALAADSDNTHLCVIEKYDTSFQLIGTHAIPLDTGMTKITGTSLPQSTLNSDSRFIGFNMDNTIVILDLAQF